jgi:tetratricopeptide (TPR) repeat protein
MQGVGLPKIILPYEHVWKSVLTFSILYRVASERRLQEASHIETYRPSWWIKEQQIAPVGFGFPGLNPGSYCFKVAPQQVDISRFTPRIHLLLQLVPEGETFPMRPSAPGVVNANVPETARREFEKGSTAFSDNKTEEGILHLEKAITLHGEYYEAQELLASAYMKQENWVKASLALHRALEIEPKAVTAMVSLGEVFRRQIRRLPENAIIEYEEYLRIDPKGQFAAEIRQLVPKLKSMIAKRNDHHSGVAQELAASVRIRSSSVDLFNSSRWS